MAPGDRRELGFALIAIGLILLLLALSYLEVRHPQHRRVKKVKRRHRL